MITIADIISAIEHAAPLSLQEGYDNAGLQVGDASQPCTGVLLCVDVTPAIIAEAVSRGCNMVVSHHPLFFKGIKQLTGATLQQQAAIEAIRRGVAVYSAHTNLDSAADGVNRTLARMLGLTGISPLVPAAEPMTGLGSAGTLAPALTADELIARIKQACGSPIVRCTAPPAEAISRLALCGGSGGSLIPDAVASGAQAYLTSDVRYHDFVDWQDKIFIIDIGHYESENCTKRIFYHLLSEKFPNFAVYYSETEKNPINYL